MNLKETNDRHEVYRLLSWWKVDKVKKAKVMVVGAGAIGNEVLKNLALMGVGNIFVVDMDTIEYSNLSRSVLFRESDAKKGLFKAEVAVERMLEINPEINCKAIVGNIGFDVGLGLIEEMDVVIGCLDNQLARLYTNRLCFSVQVPWIDAGIENLAGQVRVFRLGGTCYECGLEASQMSFINKRLGCPDLAIEDIKAGRVPTTPIASSIVAAVQVQEALKIIHGYEKEGLGNRMFVYQGMYLDADFYELNETKEDCLSHFVLDNIQSLEGISRFKSVEENLQLISEKFKCEKAILVLDKNPFISYVVDENNEGHLLNIPHSKLAEKLKKTGIRKNSTERFYITEEARIEKLNQTHPLKSLTLVELEFL